MSSQTPPAEPTAIEPGTFSIHDPLPAVGTTLLEASAGTGKTWTIGALVARFVAEGEARLEEMLVVTFGRAASQELRERVRDQLVELEQTLAARLHPELGRPGRAGRPSAVVDLLLEADDEELTKRLRRVRDALASFDGATIATTHQFCQLVLRSLGVAGDTDAGARLVEDLDELLVEVVDDLYLRGFADDASPAFSRAEGLALARAAVNDPQAHLAPADEAPDTIAGRRVAFVRAVRAEMERRKRRLGVLSYDDLLSQLADALRDEDAPARERMRQRWKVVLVDEFQDTDPVQWQVLDRAFTGHAQMVLIGDPKQAIYAFRGGDVVTYLAAAESAATRKTLATNWRSDQPLVDALQVVLRGAALGDEDIVVRPVDAENDGSRLAGAPVNAPFRLRVVRREQLGRRGRAALRMPDVRELIGRDVAHDILRLLTSGAEFDGRPLRPRDVAVLAHTGRNLAVVREALAQVGVPAVVAGGGSVFATPAATEWLRLLEAMEQPHRAVRVRSAALTSFVGHSALDLDTEGDALTDRVAATMREWGLLLGLRGVAAVLETAVAEGLTARVLSRVDGERHLTDLRHVGQALHEAALAQRLGPVALLTWLREQMAEERVLVSSERTRRLDSDAEAVQLVTIHGSKGLQYPVVYLPFVGDRWVSEPAVPLFHGGGRRTIDVGGPTGRGWHDALTRHRAEDAGESLRLLYVAMTRAQSQVVAWWAPATNAKASALHRLLLGRGPGVAEVPETQDLPDDDTAATWFAAWERNGGPAFEAALPAELPTAELVGDTSPLAARSFDREVDVRWRRTSYSSLSAAAAAAGAGHEDPPAGVGSEPEETPKEDDEPAAPGDRAAVTVHLLPDESEGPDGHRVLSPMATLPVGATFGSLVHAVLEHADPDAPDLRAELFAHVEEQLVRWPVEVDREVLVDALVAVCESPLGPLAGDATLRTVPLRDRLREMDFELPLAGGDLSDPPSPATRVRLGDVAPLLRRHLAVDDPLLPYADALDDEALGDQDLRGYLTGSVDVVLRVREGEQARFVIVDYKTNWLGPPIGDATAPPLSAADYAPDRLAAAMGHSNYPLQALLYAVVLHRYLRWRLASYDPAQHLGGVLYLYLRGMCGPDTPRVAGHPCGVFSWRPPIALVEELSDLLDGRLPTGGAS
ncbi:UvrD-helicase domain-containing protein [Nocardioides pacificus]